MGEPRVALIMMVFRLPYRNSRITTRFVGARGPPPYRMRILTHRAIGFKDGTLGLPHGLLLLLWMFPKWFKWYRVCHPFLLSGGYSSTGAVLTRGNFSIGEACRETVGYPSWQACPELAIRGGASSLGGRVNTVLDVF